MPLILILDDHSTNRSIYTHLAMLIGKDIVVESFADPFDALEWLENTPVDLIITDYKMPGMSGAEFTRRLRAIPAGSDVPVVVVTAHNDRSFRQHAMEAGATDFLRSPVDHFEFVARARNLLELPRRAGGAATSTGGPTLETLLAINAFPALVTGTDRHGRYTFVNARQAERLGATPAELVGQDMVHVLGQERGERSRVKDREVLETGQHLSSYWEETVDPTTPRFLLTSKAPLRASDGTVIGVLSISLEVEADTLPHSSSCQESGA
jgi:CheY-like chemotaxis protein